MVVTVVVGCGVYEGRGFEEVLGKTVGEGEVYPPAMLPLLAESMDVPKTLVLLAEGVLAGAGLLDGISELFGTEEKFENGLSDLLF